MYYSEIKRAVSENYGKYTDFWRALCEKEGTAADKNEMNAVTSFVQDFAENEGFFVTRIPFESCADFLVAEIGSSSDSKTAVFLAHLDTVHKIGSFGESPVRTENGIMYGPGVIDCKGGAAIGLLAMKALKESGIPAHVRLLLTTDEEVNNRFGGEKEINFIKSSSEGFGCALNLEVGKRGEAVVSRKGIIRVKIDIRGRAAHSGIDYFSGISAVREAACKIIALEEKSVNGGMTFNCSCIRGGEIINIVPDECSFTVDIRVNDIPSMKEAEDAVAEIVNKQYVSGTASQYTVISKRLPMMRNCDTELLLKKLNGVCEKYGYPVLSPVESGGGSDSAYTQAAGVPTLCALGATGDRCHTVEEYAELSSLSERAEMLALFCAESCMNKI